jgi:hypothetical protein
MIQFQGWHKINCLYCQICMDLLYTYHRLIQIKTDMLFKIRLCQPYTITNCQLVMKKFDIFSGVEEYLILIYFDALMMGILISRNLSFPK